MADDLDTFDDFDGELAIPTMRGNANLNPQDYQGIDASSILDDEIQEDVPSTPGENPGAAPAPDVEGTSRYDLYPEQDMDEPGMQQTDYGSHPWTIGAQGGYRPYSQQSTDMALGDDSSASQPKPRPQLPDTMMREPEVLNTEEGVEVPDWQMSQRNGMPSNADIDPETLYDRSSYERNDNSGDTIGSGLFDMEEGVTWRPRDGQFAHTFALPAYLADEDELGVQQSEMWDSTADNWRVVQPSAGGVTLATRVPTLKNRVSPFAPEGTGPRSHIEAFGRQAASALMDEARGYGEQGSLFLVAALEALGSGKAGSCRKVADRLVSMGYSKQYALEDVVAHCMMHAALEDLTKTSGLGALPRLDRLAKKTKRSKPKMQAAAARHLGPLTRNRKKLHADVMAFHKSPSRVGMGQVATDAGSSITAPPGLVTGKNVLIVGVLGIGGWLLWKNRKAVVKNAKKVARKVGL